MKLASLRPTRQKARSLFHWLQGAQLETSRSQVANSTPLAMYLTYLGSVSIFCASSHLELFARLKSQNLPLADLCLYIRSAALPCF